MLIKLIYFQVIHISGECPQRNRELLLDFASGDLAVVCLEHLHVRLDEAHQSGRHLLQLRHQSLIVTIEDVITSPGLEQQVTTCDLIM